MTSERVCPKREEVAPTSALFFNYALSMITGCGTCRRTFAHMLMHRHTHRPASKSVQSRQSSHRPASKSVQSRQSSHCSPTVYGLWTCRLQTRLHIIALNKTFFSPIKELSFLTSQRKHDVGTQKNCISAAIPMSTINLCFYGEITELF